jgi:hypothetical protein
MIDPSTGWFEVKDVKDKSAKESINAFDDVWLSRYPIPCYTTHTPASCARARMHGQIQTPREPPN